MELGGEINMTVIVKGEKAGERRESKYPSFWLEVHGWMVILFEEQQNWEKEIRKIANC